jgi:hypothetical protein
MKKPKNEVNMQNNFPQFTLWRNNYTQNKQCVSYPIRENIRSPDDLKNAVRFDHVFAEYSNIEKIDKYKRTFTVQKHRSNDCFLWSDCVSLDIDNSDTENEDEWVTLERLKKDFQDVSFAVATSRNHMLIKDGKAARPKFHVFFPVPCIKNAGEYGKIKVLTQKIFPYFDGKALDAARFFFGNPSSQIYFFSAQKNNNLVNFILKKAQNTQNNIDTNLNKNLLPNVPENIQKNTRQIANFKPPTYKNLAIIPSGERNSHMHKVACNLLFRFGNSNETTQKYENESKKCSPPLDFSELNAIFQSALKWYNRDILTNKNYVLPINFQQNNVKSTNTNDVLCCTSKSENLKQLEQEEPFQWQKMRPISEIIPDKFPVDCFPKTLCEFIKAVSEFSETAHEMCGVLLLGALGGVFQRKYEVISTANNTETLSIFSVIIAEPAERKSSVIKLVTTPFSLFEREYNFKNKPEISKSVAERKILQKKLVDAEKSDNNEQLINAQREFDNFSEKKPISLLSDDTTPEAIVSKMKNQDERTLVTASEGGFFKRIKGRYTPNGDDKEIYLKAHSGDRHSVDRIGRASDVLEHPAISIVMSVQKCVIDGFISDNEMNNTGMTARFLYAFCEEKAGNGRHPYRIRDFAEYNAIFERYNTIIKKILQVTIDKKDISYTKLSKETLTANSFDEACKYFYKCEERIKKGSTNAKNWNGKAFGTCIRIAGIFHLFECFENNYDPSEVKISALNIIRASKIVDCLAVHAEKVFSIDDKNNADALYLFSRIKAELRKRNNIIQFSKTELLRLTHGHFKKTEELIPALTLLEDFGYIKTNFLTTTGGRPTEQITLNPEIVKSQ